MGQIDITAPANPAKVTKLFPDVVLGGFFEYGGLAFIKDKDLVLTIPGSSDGTLPAGAGNATREDGRRFAFAATDNVTAWPLMYELGIKAIA